MASISRVHSRDQTRASDMQNLEKLIDEVESLALVYEKGIDRRKNTEKMNTDDELVYQNEFWRSHVDCIESCNENFMNIQMDSVDAARECCKRFWKCCCMVGLYNKSIYSTWPMTDIESRKLTILLAICDIERYRCEHQDGNGNSDNGHKIEPVDYDSNDRISVDTSINDDIAGYESDAEESPAATSTPK